MIQQKITTHFWFDSQAEEAANFYVSVFGEDSGIDEKTYYSTEGQEIHGMEEGTVMAVDFHLHGQSFVALNGGPHFKSTITFEEVNGKTKVEMNLLLPSAEKRKEAIEYGAVEGGHQTLARLAEFLEKTS